MVFLHIFNDVAPVYIASTTNDWNAVVRSVTERYTEGATASKYSILKVFPVASKSVLTPPDPDVSVCNRTATILERLIPQGIDARSPTTAVNRLPVTRAGSPRGTEKPPLNTIPTKADDVPQLNNVTGIVIVLSVTMQ